MEVSNTNVVNGIIKEMGGGDFLVTVNQAPDGEFVVMIKGEDMTTSSYFQRQTTTQMSLTKVTVKVQVSSSFMALSIKYTHIYLSTFLLSLILNNLFFPCCSL